MLACCLTVCFHGGGKLGESAVRAAVGCFSPSAEVQGLPAFWSSRVWCFDPGTHGINSVGSSHCKDC